jgi:hypothetical protein
MKEDIVAKLVISKGTFSYCLAVNDIIVPKGCFGNMLFCVYNDDEERFRSLSPEFSGKLQGTAHLRLGTIKERCKYITKRSLFNIIKTSPYIHSRFFVSNMQVASFQTIPLTETELLDLGSILLEKMRNHVTEYYTPNYEAIFIANGIFKKEVFTPITPSWNYGS